MKPRFFLVSYDPLVSSAAGREASKKYKLPPFIDGSIRREPDLQHMFPSISCLCRAGKFAPRLQLDDVVAYVTNKGSFGQGESQRRLTAILRVYKIFESHHAAAKWYRSRKLKLPTNCCVPGNDARPLDESHRRFVLNGCAGDAKSFAEWDETYRWRSEAESTFVVCKMLWRDLSWSAPKVSQAHLRKAFGYVPGTQNPGARTMSELKPLLRLIGVGMPDGVG
jgi:hypothetical protein